jgi:hypothetical protein
MELNLSISRLSRVTWRQKAGIIKSEYTIIARQRLVKNIPAATNTQVTIE